MNEIAQNTQKAFDSLINRGITNGTHQVIVNGETITVVIRDGVFKTAFGNH